MMTKVGLTYTYLPMYVLTSRNDDCSVTRMGYFKDLKVQFLQK